VARRMCPLSSTLSQKCLASNSVVMSRRLVEVLSQHKATLNRNGNDDPVFQDRKGGPLHHANMILREFHPALKRAGIRRMNFHCQYSIRDLPITSPYTELNHVNKHTLQIIFESAPDSRIESGL